MDPLLQRMADEMEAEKAAEGIESEQFVVNSRLRSGMAPRIWSRLRAWLKQACDDLLVAGKNVFEFEVWPNTEAQIRRLDRPYHLRVEFDADAQRIFYECGNISGEFLFRVNSDTAIFLQNPDSDHTLYTVPQAGAYLLNLLRKIR